MFVNLSLDILWSLKIGHLNPAHSNATAAAMQFPFAHRAGLVQNTSVSATVNQHVNAVLAASAVDWVAWIMLGLFLGVLLVAGVFWALARREVRLMRLRAPQPAWEPLPDFSLPAQWLAIRSGNVAAVQQALGLANPQQCSWAEGFSVSHGQRLFIAPPVQGWILVVGPALPVPEDDIDRCFHFITRLSRQLGHVQFFSRNRALGHHAWVRAHTGRIERAYAWAGETLWNQGVMTPDEKTLGLRCQPYGQTVVELAYRDLDHLTDNTENVPRLAARWSLDPASLPGQQRAVEPGISGEIAAT